MKRVFVCVVSACAALAVAQVSGAEVDCGAMRAVFGPRGELERFVSAKGIDFLETRLARPEPLWQIRLCRPAIRRRLVLHPTHHVRRLYLARRI